MGAGSDNKPPATPGNFFSSRKRRVAELFAELFRRFFLPFPYFAAVDHYIVHVALALALDLTKFHQSRFHISIFRWLDLQGNDALASRLRLCWQRDHNTRARGRFQRVVRRESFTDRSKPSAVTFRIPATRSTAKSSQPTGEAVAWDAVSALEQASA